MARVMLSLGETLGKMHRFSEADSILQMSLFLFEDLNQTSNILQSKLALGKLYKDNSLDYLAENNYALAIMLIERVRADLLLESQRRSYFAATAEVYDNMVLCLMRQNRQGDAFNYVERAPLEPFWT